MLKRCCSLVADPRGPVQAGPQQCHACQIQLQPYVYSCSSVNAQPVKADMAWGRYERLNVVGLQFHQIDWSIIICGRSIMLSIRQQRQHQHEVVHVHELYNMTYYSVVQEDLEREILANSSPPPSRIPLPSNAVHNGRCDKNTPSPIALDHANTREKTRTKIPPEI